MPNTPFFQPSFQGSRFNDHTLPFDVLEDIGSYQELLLRVAKDVYYEQNNSSRVPKGFGHGVYLKLESIEEGSAITNILLAAATFFAGQVDTKPYFQEAQRRIVETVARASTDPSFVPLLRDEALDQFNKIGRNLRDDEALDFAPGTTSSAKLNQESRRRLVLASRNATNFEQVVDVRAMVNAFSHNPLRIEVVTLDRAKFWIPLDRQYFEIASEAFSKFEQQRCVLISGTGIYNRNNRLEDIKHVREIVLLDKKDVPMQLEKLKALDDGWLDGDGRRFDRAGLQWLANAFDTYYSRTLLVPFTFPTAEGGVQFEWKEQEHDASLEVNLSSKTAYLHYYNFRMDADEEMDLDLNNPDGWRELNSFLNQYFTVASE